MISLNEHVPTATRTEIKDLDQLTKAHAANELELTTALTELRDELDAVQRKHLTRIKRIAGNFAASESDLRAAVDNGRHLFSDRKTMVLNMIKVGLRSTAGSLVFEDKAATVKLIRKLFPDLADVLIASEESPKVSVIKTTLDESDWKKIGGVIEGEGEQIVVSSTASDVEKTIGTMIKKLVAGMTESEVAS
jgi:hypothetical protein